MCGHVVNACGFVLIDFSASGLVVIVSMSVG